MIKSIESKDQLKMVIKLVAALLLCLIGGLAGDGRGGVQGEGEGGGRQAR